MDWLILSNMLLWALVVFLTIIVLTLARQISVLTDQRTLNSNPIPPSKPKIGELTKEVSGTNLEGKPVRVGGANAKSPILVLFISPTCSVCKTLVPSAISLVSQEKIDLVFTSDGESILEHQNYANDLGLKDHCYVISDALSNHYGVNKVPFALMINKEGVLVGKSSVDTREHLENLIKIKEFGVSA